MVGDACDLTDGAFDRAVRIEERRNAEWGRFPSELALIVNRWTTRVEEPQSLPQRAKVEASQTMIRCAARLARRRVRRRSPRPSDRRHGPHVWLPRSLRRALR